MGGYLPIRASLSQGENGIDGLFVSPGFGGVPAL